jgi:hypothetical protein
VVADVIAVVLDLVGAVSKVDTTCGACVVVVVTGAGACVVEVTREVVGAVTGTGTMTGGYFLCQ